MPEHAFQDCYPDVWERVSEPDILGDAAEAFMDDDDEPIVMDLEPLSSEPALDSSEENSKDPSALRPGCKSGVGRHRKSPRYLFSPKPKGKHSGEKHKKSIRIKFSLRGQVVCSQVVSFCRKPAFCK